ncbi:MAG TPA: hypothetical protein VGF88_23645 [Acidobacteriaceae bacterium]
MELNISRQGYRKVSADQLVESALLLNDYASLLSRLGLGRAAGLAAVVSFGLLQSPELKQPAKVVRR